MVQSNITLTVGSTTVVEGNTYTVPLTYITTPVAAAGPGYSIANNGIGTIGFTITLSGSTYSTAVFNSTFTADSYTTTVSPSGSTVAMTAASTGTHYTLTEDTTYTLGALTLVAGASPGTYTLNLGNSTLTDGSGNTLTVQTISPGIINVLGDPHFMSFRGESFMFNGMPDKIYNLFSDPILQINSLFGYWQTSGKDNFTYMKEIGIKFANVKIKIDAATDTILVNDVACTDATFGGGGLMGRMKTIDVLPEKYDKIKGYEGFGTFIKGILFNVMGYESLITFSTDHVNPIYLNLMMDVKSLFPEAHGVVGQTYHYQGEIRTSKGKNGEGIVEGTYEDYEVSNLFADDFKFNKWGELQMLRAS